MKTVVTKNYLSEHTLKGFIKYTIKSVGGSFNKVNRKVGVSSSYLSDPTKMDKTTFLKYAYYLELPASEQKHLLHKYSSSVCDLPYSTRGYKHTKHTYKSSTKNNSLSKKIDRMAKLHNSQYNYLLKKIKKLRQDRSIDLPKLSRWIENEVKRSEKRSEKSNKNIKTDHKFHTDAKFSTKDHKPSKHNSHTSIIDNADIVMKGLMNPTCNLIHLGKLIYPLAKKMCIVSSKNESIDDLMSKYGLQFGYKFKNNVLKNGTLSRHLSDKVCKIPLLNIYSDVLYGTSRTYMIFPSRDQIESFICDFGSCVQNLPYDELTDNDLEKLHQLIAKYKDDYCIDWSK